MKHYAHMCLIVQSSGPDCSATLLPSLGMQSSSSGGHVGHHCAQPASPVASLPGESPPAKKINADGEPSRSPSPVSLPGPQVQEQLTILPDRGFTEVWKDPKTGHWYASHSVSQEVQWLGDENTAWMVSYDDHDFGTAVSLTMVADDHIIEENRDFLDLFEVAVFTSASGMHFLEYEEGGKLTRVASLASQFNLAKATLVGVGDVPTDIEFDVAKLRRPQNDGCSVAWSLPALAKAFCFCLLLCVAHMCSCVNIVVNVSLF